MAPSRDQLRVLFWGTYDLGKPRVRLLIAGAKAQGLDVHECHEDVWHSIEDKSQIQKRRLLLLFRWLSAYPKLIAKYLLAPDHDVVLVPYMGQIDILVIWLFARLRGASIAWDAFLSLYDTVVNDRALIKANSLQARLLYALEWIACRAADLVFVDTQAHARYFETTFKLKPGSVKHIYVGAEIEFFPRATSQPKSSNTSRELSVLFYGQFIPLHGIDTIIQAAERLQQRRSAVQWIIAGQGQEQARIDALITKHHLQNVQRVSWIPYEDLHKWIEAADVCLGIFGTSEKASRVIPNKVFQIVSVGRLLISADTPAMRELFHDRFGIRLVPPGDSIALANEVLELAAQKNRNGRLPDPDVPGIRLGASCVGADLLNILGSVSARRSIS